MALPVDFLETFRASEVAFQAEDELVTILPRQNMAPIPLAGWTVPALRPMRRAEVPLWLAVLLKKQGRCAIVFPNWLEEDHLKQLVEQERLDASRFADLPWHWQPVSQALLAAAPEDIQDDVDSIRQLLQDLEELRRAKIRAGVSQINESHMQMDGISLMEINEIRPLLTQSMAALQKISQPEG